MSYRKLLFKIKMKYILNNIDEPKYKSQVPSPNPKSKKVKAEGIDFGLVESLKSHGPTPSPSHSSQNHNLVCMLLIVIKVVYVYLKVYP